MFKRVNLKEPLLSAPWKFHYNNFGIKESIDLQDYPNNLIDLLEPKLVQYGEKIAFSMGDAALNFKQLDILSRQFANFLQSQNINLGDRVAVQLPNILHYPIVILGCWRVGAVLVNINPLYTAYELAYQLNDAQAVGLIILEGMRSAYDELSQEDKSHLNWVVNCRLTDTQTLISHKSTKATELDVSNNVIVQHNSHSHVCQEIDFIDIVLSYSTKYQALDIKSDNLALLQYTGGTTGKPKGAMLTHLNVLANIIQCYEMFGIAIERTAQKNDSWTKTSQVIIFNPLPLYHIFSFTVCALLGLYGGWHNVLITNPRDIDAVIEGIAHHQPHVIPSVNTLFAAMLHHPRFRKLDFQRLVLSIGGGTAIIEKIAQDWQDVTGQTINEGYGMSEASPVIAFNPLGIRKFNGSVGLPLPNTDIKIIDDDGKVCSIGGVGEVCIKGSQVMKGYWQYDNQDVFTEDGYFKTGDIGYLNPEGYLTLVDRKKDMILVSGFNVYPNEVEAALTEHPKVREVAVVSMPDEHSGELPKAYVVKKDETLTAQELMDFAAKRLTRYKRPHAYEFIEELPKSAVGKILRKVLRDNYS